MAEPGKLTPSQLAAVHAALRNPERKLYRHPGGIWNAQGQCNHTRYGHCASFGRFSSNTALSLVKKGAAVVSRWGKRRDGGAFEIELTVHELTPQEPKP